MPAIASVRPVALDAALVDPFVIASTRLDVVHNVAVEVVLSDGSRGWGEVSVLHPVTPETTEGARAGVLAVAEELVGHDADDAVGVAERLAEALPGQSATAAGVEQAVWDARAHHVGVPLHTLFGTARAAVRTDITLPITAPARAAELAALWRGRGFDVLKVKVGHGVREDLARLWAIVAAHPSASLVLDGNEGWAAEQALDVVRALARDGVRPVLLEQPVPRDDLEGMARLVREAGVPVAADETCQGPDDVARVAREGLAHVVNLKLAKCGVVQGLRLIDAARHHGLSLMIGGMVETRIGMGFAAHLAAGVGGFDHVDLDTPWLLAEDPVLGGTPLEGPLWHPSRVASGHGGRPVVR